MRSEVFYSLIVPHYNQPQLLERLLDSLPQRDDLQVVVADDGSDAGCVEQLQALGAKFPAVEWVMLPTNRGGGAARNAALGVAKGEFVFFADADDYFCTDTLDALLNEKERWAGADLIFFNAQSLDDQTGEPSWRADRLNWMMNQPEGERERQLRYLHSEPWCKWIRRELVERNAIRFDETRIMNDVRFSYLVGHHARQVLVEKTVCYCVCNRQQSVGKKMTAGRKRDYTKVMAETNHFFTVHGLPYCYKRAYRPLVFSILKGEWNDARMCAAELRRVGESAFSIAVNVCLYPFWLAKWVGEKRKFRQQRITS